MSGALQIIGRSRVYMRPPDSPRITSERDANDLIAETHGLEAEWAVVPVEQFAPDFFRLRSGLAGAFIQKLVTYGLKVAIVGDITTHTAGSEALRAFVAESNRGRHIWFVADTAALERRLGA